MTDSVGERLRHIRLSRGLSLKQLSDLSHVPQSTLSCVETGARAGSKLTLETGRRLARALGISLDVIAGVYEEANSSDIVGAPLQPRKAGRPRKTAAVA
jgi:transcriptional regulator with XRE-family HTH domain